VLCGITRQQRTSRAPTSTSARTHRLGIRLVVGYELLTRSVEVPRTHTRCKRFESRVARVDRLHHSCQVAYMVGGQVAYMVGEWVSARMVFGHGRGDELM
jgi:hypothetical protein